ncbi:unnamed protein product, partial [Phaeothamnion confervicola]
VATVVAGLSAAASSLLASPESQAQAVSAETTATRLDYDIAPGSLAAALASFERQSGITVSTPGLELEGLSSPGVRGNHSASGALSALLKGSGFAAVRGSSGYTLSANSSADSLAEVTVVGFRAEEQGSATKTNLSIRETPQSIAVTTRESMDARQVRDLTSALELTAGLSSGTAADGGPFAGRGLGGGEGFLLRGQELDGRRDVRFDGFVVASRTFDLAPFERVEVVKGPSSVLYGQGSLGGFINMIRRKPQAQFGGSFVTQVGSFDTYRGEFDVTGSLGGSDRARGRLTAAYDNSGSFTHHVDTEMKVLAPSFAFDINDSTKVLAQLLYQRDEYTPSRGMPLRVEGDKLKIPDIPRSLFTGVPSQEKSWGEVYLATLEIDKQINDDWLMALLFQKSGVKSERFFDAYSNHFALTTSGDVYMYSDTSRSQASSWAGELRVDGKFEAFGRKHQILFGFEHAQRDDDLAFGYTYQGIGNLYTQNFRPENVLPGGAGNQLYDFDFSNDNLDQGIYGQLLLSVTDRARILFGARFDHSDIDHLNNNTDLVDSKKDDEVTFRLGTTLDVNDQITAYAVYAQTFNPTTDARSESGRILDPESGEGLEAGLKTEWFDHRLALNLAVFRQELDNIPITDPSNDNFSINGGLQRTDGVEIEASGKMSDALTFGAQFTWLDSEYVDSRDPLAGLKPYGLIDKQASAFVQYEIQDGPLHGLGFGGSIIYVGDRAHISYADVLPANDSLAGYERVDLNVYYKGIDGWDLSIQMRNVTDERYIERFRDIYQDNFFGAPRAILFRAEYSF